MDETSISSHKEMIEFGFDFFSSLFKEKMRCPIEEILKVVDLFPTKISEDMNKALIEKVYETKLFDTLFSFQK
jgi:hypothetical protein